MEQLIGTHEIAPKHTGWKRTISFHLWENYGKRRLYYSFREYNRQGRPAGHNQGQGYIDLDSGEIEAPPSDRIIIRKLLQEAK